MTKHFLKTACLAALLIVSTSAALAEIRLSDPIPVGPQVKVGKLANGLTYYIQKNGKPEKKLELRLVVKAGSVLEDDDQQGLAHFVEHMAFNGSTNFKKHELVSYLQSIGVKWGADLNAYTSFDETVYILPIPTDKRDNVDKGFTVLEDWAHGLTLNDADIDKERDIVLDESRQGKGAGDRMNKVLMPKFYNGSRYAQRLPIGQDSDPQIVQAGRAQALLPRLVPPRPDGGGGGRRHRAGRRREAGRVALRRPEEPGAPAPAPDHADSGARGNRSAGRHRQGSVRQRRGDPLSGARIARPLHLRRLCAKS